MAVSSEYYVKNTRVSLKYGSGTNKVKFGKVHKYLGGTLDYYTVGQVFDYIDEIIGDFDKEYQMGGGT